MTRPASTLLFALAIGFAAGRAAAQEEEEATVDAAIAAYEEADFERANALFDRLILGSSIDREDLVRIYATRALLRFGDGDAEGMLHDLTALASLEPEYELGPRAPPPVQQAFDRVRESGAELALEVRLEASPAGVRVIARALHDRADIVRALVVGGRGVGGSYRESTDGSVTVAQASDEIEYYARIVGPGGATLAARGSRETPQRERVAPLRSDDTWAIVLGVGGGLVAAAAAILITVFLVPQGSNQIVGPTLTLPAM